MSKTPARDAARPHGRRRAVSTNSSALARVAAKAGLASGDRFGHRSAVVALSLGLLAVAGGGAAATANATDLARASAVTSTASSASVSADPSEKTVLASAAADQAAQDKAAAQKAAADKAAQDKAAADKAAADKAAADKAAADKAAAAPPQAVNDPAGAQAYAASRLSAYGWGQDQMSALITLWNKESDWTTTATNASSGAYGIAQSLPAGKMASAGADWQTNYKTQIEWGLNYIKQSYGSPANALAFHLVHNWY
ncbi:hypothetical protein GCM10012320_05370 [Sinomonas cellulolyticus]|uniref:aggregation-promoting factor C-terminal-like domain-containing protein n=1 Tax=Sinomonas cellulolyticus TaxID=2801916 RepID=UPI0019C67F38|nr:MULTISPECIES: hypothetical protein [Sinomonas]GHG42411.1 hypothetical protein GCM10012320_05370 [Sinomonas sp. KCTC 49339]